MCALPRTLLPDWCGFGASPQKATAHLEPGNNAIRLDFARPIDQDLFARLRDVLTGADKGAAFASLSAADRSAILEILHATKPEF